MTLYRFIIFFDLTRLLQASPKCSESELRQYLHNRQQWVTLLEPTQSSVANPAFAALLPLLGCMRSSSSDVIDALVHVLVHLVELSDELGLALLEPFVDRVRAEILQVSAKANSSGSDFVPQEHLYLLRLLLVATRLLENTCCRWVLNGHFLVPSLSLLGSQFHMCRVGIDGGDAAVIAAASRGTVNRSVIYGLIFS